MRQGFYPLNMTQRTVPAGITKHVGNTPLLRVRLFEREFPGLEVYAKAEWFNPGGSVKDRPALSMIEDWGERRGALTPDKTIIDATSGNTGIAYALLGAAKGYRVKLVMPGNVSTERKTLVRAFGAEIVYSDAGDGIRRRHPAGPVSSSPWTPRPTSIPTSIRTRPTRAPTTTAPRSRSWSRAAARLTHFIAGLGTTGTFVGTSRRLKEHDPSIRTIAVEPDDSFDGLEGLKHLPTAIVPKIWHPGVGRRDLVLPDRARLQPRPRGWRARRACWSATPAAPRCGRRDGWPGRSMRVWW